MVSVEHRVGVLQAAHESYNKSINQKFGKETDCANNIVCQEILLSFMHAKALQDFSTRLLSLI